MLKCFLFAIFYRFKLRHRRERENEQRVNLRQALCESWFPSSSVCVEDYVESSSRRQKRWADVCGSLCISVCIQLTHVVQRSVAGSSDLPLTAQHHFLKGSLTFFINLPSISVTSWNQHWYDIEKLSRVIWHLYSHNAALNCIKVKSLTSSHIKWGRVWPGGLGFDTFVSWVKIMWPFKSGGRKKWVENSFNTTQSSSIKKWLSQFDAELDRSAQNPELSSILQLWDELDWVGPDLLNNMGSLWPLVVTTRNCRQVRVSRSLEHATVIISIYRNVTYYIFNLTLI